MSNNIFVLSVISLIIGVFGSIIFLFYKNNKTLKYVGNMSKLMISIAIILLCISVILLSSEQKKFNFDTYQAPVTLSLPEWRKYVAEGKNTLYGSGGIIPGSTFSGNIYKGHVRQGIESGYINNEESEYAPIGGIPTGIGWTL